MTTQTQKSALKTFIESCEADIETNYVVGSFRQSSKDLIVYKKVCTGIPNPRGGQHMAIATLKIKSFNPIFVSKLKCRTSSAEVISIEKITSKNTLYKNRKRNAITKAYSIHDPKFVYEVGKEVVPTNQFSYNFDDCTYGIHFFFDLQDALNY